MPSVERRADHGFVTPAVRVGAAWMNGVAAILCAVMTLSPAPAALRLPFALALVLWLPGSALVGLAARGMRGAEAWVLSVALSLALAAICGVALNAIGALDARGWALALAGITVGAAALAWRPASASRIDRPGGLRWRGLDVTMFGLAALLAVAAATEARRAAMAPAQFPYTEFWLVPEAAGDSSAMTIGIRNVEQVAATYEVDILEDGRLVGRWPPLDLAPGATVTTAIGRSRAPAGRRLEARLYRDGNRQTIYRRAWSAGASRAEAR